MELGEKLLQARQEAGLSQRQLCGDVITRNMLSQIEHGTARPSMATLQYLASRLGKPVSWFLEEEMPMSPNQELMTHARRAYGEGKWQEVRTILEGYRSPDETFRLECRYLRAATTLQAAREAAEKKKTLYARALLTDMAETTEGFPGLERQRLLQLAALTRAGISQVCSQLPSLDEELYHRARGALEAGSWQRGLALLDAMEVPTETSLLLRGRLLVGKQDYAAAVPPLKAAETGLPEETAPLLEICFRELGDYQQAYFYACRQRR